MIYRFDDYALDSDRRELRHGAALVALEPQVFDLLEHLILNRARVVSRDDLIEAVWGGRIVSESALSTRINAARNAIGDSGAGQRLIKTLPRKGVRFIGEVRQEQQPPEAVAAVDTESPPAAMPSARRHLFDRRAMMGAAVAVGIVCAGMLTLNYVARSERRTANIETAARLDRTFDQINMISREDYEAVRNLQQWAVDLDPNNLNAKVNLIFALTTGAMNDWSVDTVVDMAKADTLLQEVRRIEPGNFRARGAECQLLRAKRQYESAVQMCGKYSPNAFLLKEVGYDKLMLGQLDEALANFFQAEQMAPNSRLRWSWREGIGLVYLMQGEDQKAIEWLNRAAHEAPNAARPEAYLASAYALVGREQEAHEALDHHIKLWPATTLNTIEPVGETPVLKNKMHRVLEGLRLAGLPE